MDCLVNLLYLPTGRGEIIFFRALIIVSCVDLVVGRDVGYCKICTIWRHAESSMLRLLHLINSNKAKSALWTSFHLEYQLSPYVMTWRLAWAWCKIPVMCSDKHHDTSFRSKNFRFTSIKREISVVVQLNVSQPRKETTSDRLTSNRGTVWIPSTLQLYAAGYIFSRPCKLTVICSIVTCSLQYIPQDFPHFGIIILTYSTTAIQGSTKTSAQCDWIRIEQNDRRFIECDPGRDKAATQTPVSPPWRCNCSSRQNDQGRTFQKST